MLVVAGGEAPSAQRISPMDEPTAHHDRLDKPAIVVWSTSPEDAVACVRRAGLTVA
jgi:hypothetical protein